jgi:hypothetical protein
MSSLPPASNEKNELNVPLPEAEKVAVMLPPGKLSGKSCPLPSACTELKTPNSVKVKLGPAAAGVDVNERSAIDIEILVDLLSATEAPPIWVEIPVVHYGARRSEAPMAAMAATMVQACFINFMI